jgi:hypothetical protein
VEKEAKKVAKEAKKAAKEALQREDRGRGKDGGRGRVASIRKKKMINIMEKYLMLHPSTLLALILDWFVSRHSLFHLMSDIAML